MQNKWTDSQLKQAFYLYCLLPFGKLHSRTPGIIELANKIARTPSAVAMKLVNFASLDPAITATGRKGLSGASANDKRIWEAFHANWDGLVDECAASDLTQVRAEQSEPTNFEIFKPPINAGQDVFRATKTRVGQQFFRQSVLANYKEKCCISGLDLPSLLVASHIVPWAIDSEQRLNPSNGLCLSSLHDRAFDQGLITLDNNYCVMVSAKIKHSKSSFIAQSVLSYEGVKITPPDKFFPDKALLEHHRNKIFRR